MRNIFIWLLLSFSFVFGKERNTSEKPSLLPILDDTIFWNYCHENAQNTINSCPDSALMWGKTGLLLAIKKGSTHYTQLFQDILFSAAYKTQDANFDKAFYLKQVHTLREESVHENIQQAELVTEIREHYRVQTMALFLAMVIISLLFATVLYLIYQKYKEKERVFKQELAELSILNSHSARAPVATILGLVGIYNRKNLADKFNGEVVRMVEDEAQKLDDILHEIARRTYK
jgi:hypothetical protein